MLTVTSPPSKGAGGMLIINELSKSLLIPISSLIDKIKTFQTASYFLAIAHFNANTLPKCTPSCEILK